MTDEDLTWESLAARGLSNREIQQKLDAQHPAKRKSHALSPEAAQSIAEHNARAFSVLDAAQRSEQWAVDLMNAPAYGSVEHARESGMTDAQLVAGHMIPSDPGEEAAKAHKRVDDLEARIDTRRRHDRGERSII